MKPIMVLALSMPFALATTACGSAAMQTEARQPPFEDVQDNPNKPPRPQIKRNPDPTAYEITLTIENAPGPFASVEGLMQYQVLDDRCLPDLGGISGTRLDLVEGVPITYTRVADNTYRGTVYTDLLIDEDYFGLGVCHWSLVTAWTGVKAGTGQGEATFFENIFHDDLLKKEHRQAYFWKGHYPRAAVENANISSEKNPSAFKPEFKPELFSLAFDIRKISP
jgi:hypothetical protein